MLPPLRERIVEVDGIVDDGEALFQQMVAQHAEPSWQAVRGDGTEADNRLAWARESLDAASANLASDETERWAAVPEQVEQALGWLDEAVALVQSIRDQHRHLEEARQAAPQEIQLLQDDLVRARAYIRQHDRNIRDQLAHDLDQAEPAWEQVSQELALEKPDYPAILARIQGVRQVVERILAEARSEHESIERQVQRYAGEVRVIQGTLSVAANYLRDHAGDVGRDARTQVQQAEQSLQSAQQHREQAEGLEDTARLKALTEAVALLQEAGQRAERAYARARQDVARAEESRLLRLVPVILAAGQGARKLSGVWGTPSPAPTPRPASRPRPASTPRPSPSSRPASGRRSGGGSSTGWGRPATGRSSGGSSTNWGSSSRRRGGGSTGW